MKHDSSEDKVIPLHAIGIVFAVLLKIILILMVLGFMGMAVNAVYNLLGAGGFLTLIVAITVTGILLVAFIKITGLRFP